MFGGVFSVLTTGINTEKGLDTAEIIELIKLPDPELGCDAVCCKGTPDGRMAPYKTANSAKTRMPM